MKVLILSTLFHPSVGGIETVSQILAEDLARLEHKVTVVTESDPGVGRSVYPYDVVRNPSLLHLNRLIRAHDISIHACVSLKYLWLFLLHDRPVFTVHHTWYQSHSGSIGLRERLKLWLATLTHNIAVSDAIKQRLPESTLVIENPFRDDLFRIVPDITRAKDLVFLGRLVSDKGVHLLLAALNILKAEGILPKLTIIGDGPEMENLKSLAERLQLNRQISFLGSVIGEPLRDELNAHKIMVIPSVWEEPFGIIALEGLACGLKIVAADCAGLRQSLAQFGTYFERGKAHSLAECLRSELAAYSETFTGSPTEDLKRHLTKHSRREVVEQYLQAFHEISWYPRN